jgi:hypothetical protein
VLYRQSNTGRGVSKTNVARKSVQWSAYVHAFD